MTKVKLNCCATISLLSLRTRKRTTMKRIAVGFAVVCLLLVAVWFCHWRQNLHRPKRVSVSYAEKYEDKTIGRAKDFEYVQKDSGLYAEERLSQLLIRNQNCMVLTHDEGRADYHLSISVIRFLGDPKMFGEASLSMTRANGDVVLAEHFYQDQDSKEDIRQQPITRAWEELCATDKQK